jgi:hypothetical protein
MRRGARIWRSAWSYVFLSRLTMKTVKISELILKLNNPEHLINNSGQIRTRRGGVDSTISLPPPVIPRMCASSPSTPSTPVPNSEAVCRQNKRQTGATTGGWETSTERRGNELPRRRMGEESLCSFFPWPEINSTTHEFSGQDTSRSAGQVIDSLLWNLKTTCRVHKTQLLVSILSQMNPVHILL